MTVLSKNVIIMILKCNSNSLTETNDITIHLDHKSKCLQIQKYSKKLPVIWEGGVGGPAITGKTSCFLLLTNTPKLSFKNA